MDESLLRLILVAFVILIMAVGIGVPLIMSSRWNIELIKRDREARIHNDQVFIRRLTRIRIMDVVVDTMQLPLVPLAYFAKPSVTGWIVVGGVFIVSVVVRLMVNRAKLSLLADEGAPISQVDAQGR